MKQGDLIRMKGTDTLWIVLEVLWGNDLNVINAKTLKTMWVMPDFFEVICEAR